MSVINLNVNEAKDLVLLEDGDYELRIISAEVKKSKAGNEYINVRLESIDNPEGEDLYHMLMLPSENVEDFEDEKAMQKQNNKRLLAIRDFYSAFGVDATQEVDTQSDLPGLVGRALVNTKSDPEFGDKNVIKRFLASR